MIKKICLIGFFCLVILAIFYPRPLQEMPSSDTTATDLPILVYHAITFTDDDEGMTSISYSRFAEEMAYLHDNGYTTLSMDEVVQFIHGKKFPKKSVAINFDDGLTSTLKGLPLLMHYGFNATLWIIAGRAQPDPHIPGADRSYMSWLTLWFLGLQPHFGIYSHTMTHPWEKGNTLADWQIGLTPGKSIKDVQFELTESRRLLEDHLAGTRTYLNWPAGVYNPELTKLAKEAGYTAAVTADDGLNHPGVDLFLIHRVMVNGKCDLKTFEKLLGDAKYRGC